MHEQQSPQQSRDFSSFGKAWPSCSLPLTQGWGTRPCSLSHGFYNTWDPSAAWATRKGPRSCHCLKEPGEAAGNYTHISWSWFYNKTSHLNSLINDGQPGFRKRSSRLTNWPEFSRGPSARVHTRGESISWETHKTFTKLHGRLMSHIQQTAWTVGTRERRYFSISWRLATARKRESG